MHYLVGLTMIGGRITWQDMGDASYGGEGLTLTFPMGCCRIRKDAEESLAQTLRDNEVLWLQRNSVGWKLDTRGLLEHWEKPSDLGWLQGILNTTPDFYSKRESTFGQSEDRFYLRFLVRPEDIMDQLPKRIFLSHRRVDKPKVRRFKAALEAIGLVPWLDEDAMPAGTPLERGLLQGFERSCAAVFFVTPSFSDEGYLASEVDYAVGERRKKGDRFSIISILLKDDAGNQGEVPKLLRPYLWKSPETELDTLIEIVRAIPLRIEETGWK